MNVPLEGICCVRYRTRGFRILLLPRRSQDECVNALCCHVVFVFENTQEEMFRSYDATFKDFGLQISDLENPFQLA